jgi:hypothetical protein
MIGQVNKRDWKGIMEKNGTGIKIEKGQTNVTLIVT